MSTTSTVDVLRVHKPATPRGSMVAAYWFSRLLRWLFTPPQPRVRTRGEQATYVREMAYRVMNTDPGFAADLFAAAARHESLDD